MKDVSGVEMAEGHAFAFGIGIDKDSFPTFKTHLNSILDKIDLNANLYMVDMIADCKAVNIDVAEIMAADDIWAHGVDKPQAIIKNIPTDKYELMGTEQQHIKIDCGKYDVVIFNAPDLAATLESGEKYNLTVAGEFDIDKAYNVGRLQFIVKDYELTDYTPQSIWDYAF